MKFKKGDKVKKVKGYKFEGVVLSGYEVEGGERYDVQVNGKDAISSFRRIIERKDIELHNHLAAVYIEELLMNCDGMIHIFSGNQLEYAE